MPSTVLCPHCGSDRVFPSHARSISDLLVFFLLLRRVRCHACMRRFFASLWFRANPRGIEVTPLKPRGISRPPDDNRKSA